MTKTHNIPIEGLPEGWMPVAFRKPVKGESCVAYDGSLLIVQHSQTGPKLIIEKIQPRRIVLEETDEDNEREGVSYKLQRFGNVAITDSPKIWREVKEGE